MTRAVFVTGTDTEIGKTVVSRLLIEGLARTGNSVVGMKPVASGCERTPQGLRNLDAGELMAVSNVQVDYETINPYAFEPPISPHLAAQQAGIEIELPTIKQRFEILASKVDWVVVEGVGGWYAPLSDQYTVMDMARALDLPIVLVVGMRLGCLNHALLTQESILSSGLKLIGWVANCVEPDMLCLSECVDTLSVKLDAPLLGVIPHFKTMEPEMGLGMASHLCGLMDCRSLSTS